jgi:uncharacterized membrane protein
MTAELVGVVADGGYWMHGGAGSGWWMGGMMVGMLAFWAAIVLGIVWLAGGSHRGRWPRTGEEALGTLDRRFAEGAISLDEYYERKAVLAGEQVVPANPSVEAITGEEVGT